MAGSIEYAQMKKSKFEKFLTKQFERRIASTQVEVERKYRVQDIEPIRKKLRKIKAKRLRSGWEHNELYDHEKTLRREKQTLRLRYQGEEAWLTFKGPRQKGYFKRRVEIESPVHFESMKRILHIMGFRIVSIYRKNREEYELPHAKICLDYLPKVGWFVEIEGTGKTIRQTAKKLGLEDKHHEKRSYRRLLKEELVAV